MGSRQGRRPRIISHFSKKGIPLKAEDEAKTGAGRPGFPIPSGVRLEKVLPACVFLIYAALIYPLYFLPAYTPDEYWFFSEARKIRPFDAPGFLHALFHHQNTLGYGSLYWVLTGAAAQAWGEGALPVLRAFAYGAMLGIPLIFFAGSKLLRGAFSLFPFLLWFTFPLAWWSGKLTGPEIPSLFFLTAGTCLVLSHERPRFWVPGALLLGIAAGIKANALAGAAFPGLIFFARYRKDPKILLSFGAAVFAGIFLTNPFLLFSPQVFLENTFYKDPSAQAGGKSLARLLWKPVWEWDAVFSGGLLSWSLSVPALLSWIAFLRLSSVPGRLIAAAALCFAGASILFLGYPTFYGWYWFPACVLFIFVSMHGRARTKGAVSAALLTLALNAVFSFPVIRAQIESKHAHAEALEHREAVQNFVEKNISWLPVPPYAVIDYSDMGLWIDTKPVLGARFEPVLRKYRAYEWVRDKEYLQNMPPGGAAAAFISPRYLRYVFETGIEEVLPAPEGEFLRFVVPSPYLTVVIIFRRGLPDGPAAFAAMMSEGRGGAASE